MAVQLSSFTICVCVITRVTGNYFSFNTVGWVYQNGGPVYGMYQNGGPIYGMYQNGGPIYGMYQNGGPIYGVYQNGGPVYGVYQNGGPIYGVYQNGDPVNGMHQNGGQVNEMHQNGGPVNEMHQNNVPVIEKYRQEVPVTKTHRNRDNSSQSKTSKGFGPARNSVAFVVSLTPPPPSTSTSLLPPGAAFPDTYCAYCRHRRFQRCIQLVCNSGTGEFQPSLPSPQPSSSAAAEAEGEGGGERGERFAPDTDERVGSAGTSGEFAASLTPPPAAAKAAAATATTTAAAGGGFGARTPTDTYCTYCMNRGLHRCIKHWCISKTFAASLPLLPPPPPPPPSLSSSSSAAAAAAALAAAEVLGTSQSADTICEYCRRRGSHRCIQLWCNSRAFAASHPLLPPLPPPSSSSAAAGAGFGIGTPADTYCAYCRRRGSNRCIKHWCNKRAFVLFPPSPPLSTGSFKNDGYYLFTFLANPNTVFKR